MLGSTFKCSVVEDGCKIALLPGLQHCKALQNCSPWQPEVSKLQEFPRHCPSKAAKLQTWQSKPAKLQALQALVASRASAPTLQGFAKLQPLYQPAKALPKQRCQTTDLTRLQNRQPARFQHCRVAKLQPLPTLPTCQSFNTAGFPLAARSAKLQIRLQNPNCKAPTLNCRARLQTTTSC